MNIHFSTESLSLAAHVRALAKPIHSEEYSPQDCIDAIQELQVSPAKDVWNRGLITALAHPDDAVREKGLEACQERLGLFSRNFQAQDDFLDALLDFCFHNIHNTEKDVRPEVLQTVTDFLLKHPLEYEHHRGRMLISIREIQYTQQSNLFASKAVRCQKFFAFEKDPTVDGRERSDVQIVLQIHQRRKQQAYKTSTIQELALLEYLYEDRRISPNRLERDLFENYRDLFIYQMDVPKAYICALRNLQDWLLPSSWDYKLQIVAHKTLLPGSNRADDLLSILRNRYSHNEGEEVLRAGLQTLCYFPGMRSRIPELLDFLREPHVQNLGPSFWEAALELIESLVTGLSRPQLSAVMQSDDTIMQNIALEDYQYHLKRDAFLDRDNQLRTFLHDYSQQDTNPLAVRQRAWQILLDCVPQDPQERMPLYSEALSDLDHPFFFITLELARQTRQRAVWHLLMQSWERLIASDRDTQRRRERLEQVCQLFSTLRIYATVSSHSHHLAPIIALAFDDDDPEVRSVAFQSIREAGYSFEYELEAQRRKLEELQKQATEIAADIAQLYQRQNELEKELNQWQDKTAKLNVHVETHTQQRNQIYIEYKRITSELQSEFRWIELEINNLEGKARQRENSQKRLGQEISEQQTRWNEARINVTSLEEQLFRTEHELQSRQQELEAIEQSIANIDMEIAQAQWQIGFNLNTLHQQQRIQELYHQRQIQEGKKAQCETNNLSVEINRVQLLPQLQIARDQLNNYQNRLEELDTEFNHGQEALVELRQYLRDLEGNEKRVREKMKKIQAKMQQQIDQHDSIIRLNREQLEQIQQSINTCKQEIMQKEDAIQQGGNSLQSTTKKLNIERQYYASLAKRAGVESIRADQEGVQAQAQFEAELWESQKQRVSFAYRIELAVEQPGVYKSIFRE